MGSDADGWYLSLDTSGNTDLCLAKVVGGKIVKAFESTSTSKESSHSEEITNLVNSTLKDGGIEYSDLSALIIGLGPGSFTGLRIGLSFFKGVSFSYRIPLIGVSSFKAISFSLRDTAKILISVNDARRGEFFVGVYKAGPKGSFDVLMPPQIIMGSELETRLKIFFKGNDIIDTAIILPNVPVNDYYEPLLSLGLPILRSRRLAVSLIEIAIGEGDIERGEFSLEGIGHLQPDYVREMAAKTIAERNAIFRS